MRRLVISTVGTSLLTNQINERKDPKHWLVDLTKTANFSSDKITKEYPEVDKIIQKLKERAEEKLDNSNILEIREASAELNGIYGLYTEKLEDATSDIHILITTDTAQGRTSAQIIESFLRSNGLTNVTPWIQPEFSLANSDIFTESIAKLIPEIEKTIVDSKKSNYRICFNLVGGFKALQGYFNIIGMFYADEIIYIFEGSNELIKIPRLPVKVKNEEVEPHKVPLAMMDQGDVSISFEEARKVPEEWVVTDGQEMILSTWGQLIWNQCKDELLSNNLLKFPKVDYKSSFIEDYKKIEHNLEEKVKLQEVIAKVAVLLQKSNGNTSLLKQDGGLQYDKYTNMKDDIAHFRVTQGIRVSCTSSNGILFLHRYGKEPVVNKNPY